MQPKRYGRNRQHAGKKRCALKYSHRPEISLLSVQNLMTLLHVQARTLLMLLMMTSSQFAPVSSASRFASHQASIALNGKSTSRAGAAYGVSFLSRPYTTKPRKEQLIRMRGPVLGGMSLRSSAGESGQGAESIKVEEIAGKKAVVLLSGGVESTTLLYSMQQQACAAGGSVGTHFFATRTQPNSRLRGCIFRILLKAVETQHTQWGSSRTTASVVHSVSVRHRVSTPNV